MARAAFCSSRSWSFIFVRVISVSWTAVDNEAVHCCLLGHDLAEVFRLQINGDDQSRGVKNGGPQEKRLKNTLNYVLCLGSFLLFWINSNIVLMVAFN